MMRRMDTAAAMMIALIATPVLAAEDAKPAPDQTVKLSAVALPIVTNGQVINYIFIEAHILLTPSADVIALRDKEPYFRDALVRAAYRTPFVIANNPNKADENKLKAALFREATAIAGPNKIKSVVIDSQTPKHQLPLAKPAPPATSPPAAEIP